MSLTAVILCGGQGTRLRPVIGDVPKCLAPVAGRPFIEYILDHLHKQGVNVCFFCSNEKVEPLLEQRFGTDWHGMELGYDYNDKGPAGSGGDLAALKKVLSHSSYHDPLLVMNGDTYCPFALKHLLDDFQAGREHYFALDVYGLIRGEKGNWARAGVTLVEKTFLFFIPREEHIQLEDCFKIFRGGVWRYTHNHPPLSFIDMGTPEGYQAAEGFLREQGVIT